MAVGADLALRASRQLATPGGATLEGDRWVEWSFCMARMASTATARRWTSGPISVSCRSRPRSAGTASSPSTARDIPAVHARACRARDEADILDRPLEGRSFDQIVNCSSVKHVGLGGRYGSGEADDGDIEAMGIMADLLADDGRMILTIPVGRDGKFPPQHRVYGDERLPRLLERYAAIEEQYWAKEGPEWKPVDKATALATQGSESFTRSACSSSGAPERRVRVAVVYSALPAEGGGVFTFEDAMRRGSSAWRPTAVTSSSPTCTARAAPGDAIGIPQTRRARYERIARRRVVSAQDRMDAPRVGWRTWFQRSLDERRSSSSGSPRITSRSATSRTWRRSGTSRTSSTRGSPRSARTASGSGASTTSSAISAGRRA